ncbi:8817_t:CDS:1 [Cetraspora pellucida]|uniref:8817_t:CDS:1 n=1 Tax=Cetraspora pellucida TaxID=1433469 RepID=A0A9N8YUP7_9GLOM|nr:8817_t:CDS:1 [Cetraspora pellucida]
MTLSNKCTICLEEIISFTFLPCTHTFHSKCISTWLKEHKSCPMCRDRLDNEDIEFVTSQINNSYRRKLKRKRKEDQDLIESEFNNLMTRLDKEEDREIKNIKKEIRIKRQKIESEYKIKLESNIRDEKKSVSEILNEYDEKKNNLISEKEDKLKEIEEKSYDIVY